MYRLQEDQYRAQLSNASLMHIYYALIFKTLKINTTL